MSIWEIYPGLVCVDGGLVLIGLTTSRAARKQPKPQTDSYSSKNNRPASATQSAGSGEGHAVREFAALLRQWVLLRKLLRLCGYAAFRLPAAA